MKVATITWITYNNYGTELQAYALQQYLKELGIDNDIISDQYIVSDPPKSEAKNQVSPTIVLPEARSTRAIRRIQKYLFHPLRLIKTIRMQRQDRRRSIAISWYWDSQRRYADFKENHLTIVCGLTRECMGDLNHSYDAFLCGSDQIWSVFNYNFDGYFYLNFAKKKKISYAASIGTDSIPPEKEAQISAWLMDYDAVSVRESATAEHLTRISGQSVQWVCDPTLLYDSSFWEKLCNTIKTPGKKYIVCYFLSKNSWYFTYASALAKYLKLKLVLIPSCVEYTQSHDCCKQGVGPQEFVALIKNAQFVLTDSYHGSIFGLLFEKNFLYLKRFSDDDPNCQNIRVTSLFDKLGLQKHIISEKDFSPNDIQNPEYHRINDILYDFRRSSREFLRNALL